MRHLTRSLRALLAVLAVGACGPATEPFLRADIAPPAWFQLDDAQPDSDELTGYVLRAGRVGASPSVTFDLPPEAFVAGPYGDEILVGQDDGARSVLEVVNAIDGGRRVIVESEHVLRRAAKRGDDVFVLVLHRKSRNEIGVFRFDASADGPQRLEDGELALAGLPPDDSDIYGPTFHTVMRPTESGIVVQSCGELLCRARVLDLDTGNITLRDEIGQGELIGVSGRTLVAWESANGWPCKVLGIDVDTGAATELAHAYGAVLSRGEDGVDTLVYESGGSPGQLFEQELSAELPEAAPRLLAVFTDDLLHPVPHTDLSLSGLVLPDGFVAIGGDGRVAMPGGAPDPLLLRQRDGALFETVFE